MTLLSVTALSHVTFLELWLIILTYWFLFQDVAKLTALSPEVISRQATINIGMD